MADTVETHPVQVHARRGQQSADRPRSQAPVVVTMRAYEVYCHVFGEQEVLVTGGCRGGFSAGELVALLYARSFPKDQWSARFRQALCGLDLDCRS